MEPEKPNGNIGGGGVPHPSTFPPFLTKCYDMVNDPATDDTVCWGDSENTFIIKDQHTFSRDLLPKYFKHSNISSFIRQLNTYGGLHLRPPSSTMLRPASSSHGFVFFFVREASSSSSSVRLRPSGKASFFDHKFCPIEDDFVFISREDRGFRLQLRLVSHAPSPSPTLLSACKRVLRNRGLRLLRPPWASSLPSMIFLQRQWRLLALIPC
ncbi:hypothetical protein M5K25_018306 [Dendrobium thyrsiflorum]|uniref:HSF-type DNA-binding domain-containing protein n=1 Tax=Dendrobium thyrsiflorum TaxID=117978 RepID=A0ABD0UPU9_DENTH